MLAQVRKTSDLSDFSHEAQSHFRDRARESLLYSDMTGRTGTSRRTKVLAAVYHTCNLSEMVLYLVSYYKLSFVRSSQMTSAERAKEQLTLAPEAEFTLEKNGFIGALYRPEKDEYPEKAVIMFGGSDGIYNLTKLVAEPYVKRGMTILALA